MSNFDKYITYLEKDLEEAIKMKYAVNSDSKSLRNRDRSDYFDFLKKYKLVRIKLSHLKHGNNLFTYLRKHILYELRKKINTIGSQTLIQENNTLFSSSPEIIKHTNLKFTDIGDKLGINKQKKTNQYLAPEEILNKLLQFKKNLKKSKSLVLQIKADMTIKLRIIKFPTKVKNIKKAVNKHQIRYISVVLDEQLSSVFPFDLSSDINEIKVCSHEVSGIQFKRSLFEGYSALEKIQGCSNCKNDWGYFILSSLIETNVYSGPSILKTKLGDFEYQQYSFEDKFELCRQPKGIIRVDNRLYDIISYNPNRRKKIGIFYDGSNIDKEVYVDFLGIGESVSFIRKEYHPRQKKIFYEISKFIPNLKLILYPDPAGYENQLMPESPIEFEITDRIGSFEFEMGNDPYRISIIRDEKDLLDRDNLVDIIKTQTENLIHRDIQLDMIVDYSGIKRSRIIRYLSQFNDSDQKILLQILEHMQFYKTEDLIPIITEKIVNIYTNIKPKVKTLYLSTIIQNEGIKSDVFLNYYLQPELKIHLNPKQYTGQDLSDNDILIFVDDMVGTGNQFCNGINQLFGDELPNCRIFLIPGYIYLDGISNINEKYPEIIISAIHKLSDNHKIRSPGVVFTENDLKQAISLLKLHGSEFYWLGYNNFGGSIVVETERVSNLVPDIFWRTSRNRYPLFRRP